MRNKLHSELEKREISRVSRRERLVNSSLVGSVSELIGTVLIVLVPAAAGFWLKTKNCLSMLQFTGHSRVHSRNPPKMISPAADIFAVSPESFESALHQCRQETSTINFIYLNACLHICLSQ